MVFGNYCHCCFVVVFHCLNSGIMVKVKPLASGFTDRLYNLDFLSSHIGRILRSKTGVKTPQIIHAGAFL